MNDRQHRRLAYVISEMIEVIEDDGLVTDDKLIEASLRPVIAARDADLPIGGRAITPALTTDLNRTTEVLQSMEEE